MNTEDYAIIVGIDDYVKSPYERLKGAKRDAMEFVTWLKSPTGGDLPPKNVDPFTKLSTDDGTTPVYSELLPMVSALRKLAPPGKRRIGRRLYIYLSGHGVSPDDLDEAGLVTVESDEDFTLTFPGKDCADKLCLGAQFEEVLLFMDCCRLREPQATMNLPLRVRVDDGGAATVKRFYAFATAFGRVAREVPFGGETRGVFSRHLMEGLKTGADGNGRLTTSTLRNFLETRMSAIEIEGEKQTPRFAVADEVVVLAGRPPRNVNVILALKAPPPVTIAVLDGGNNLKPIIPANFNLTPAHATFAVPAGKRYVIQALDAAGLVMRTIMITAAQEDVHDSL
jgi:hypothetical protein